MKKTILILLTFLISTNLFCQTKTIHFKGELKLGFDNIMKNFWALTNDKNINGDLLAKYKIYDEENNLLWTRDVRLFITDVVKLFTSRRPYRNKIAFDVPINIKKTRQIKFQVEVCGSVGLLSVLNQCKYIEKNKSIGWWTKYISRTVNVGTIEFVF